MKVIRKGTFPVFARINQCFTISVVIFILCALLTFQVGPTEQCQQTGDVSHQDVLERENGDSSLDNGNENNSHKNHFHRRRGNTEDDSSSQFMNQNNRPSNDYNHNSNGNERQGTPVLNKQPGIICPDIYPVDSFPPKAPIIPDIFTVAVETVFLKEQKRQIWNLHVDRAEKIVVHKVDLPNVNGKRYECFYSKIVRDFRSGLEFRISNAKGTPDCVVEPINNEFELTSNNLRRFMLEHAKLLLNFDPSFVNYWGKRSIRNLQCDIWLHESLSEFVSEFGFANDSSLPISVATFSRESKPDIIAISNIYEDSSETFHPFAKTQGHPDVSECLDSTPLLLRIVLDAPYTKLKAGREFTVLESIRRAVAGLAGISLLRVTDLALTEFHGDLTAFWFSLRQIVNFQELSRNNNTSHSTIVFPLADAYRILRDVISRHDVTLRVDLAPNEHMLVGIQRGSLISIPRALHPIYTRSGNTQSLSIIKASYTSGAVAGLGLAMAVLGLAIGLLLGFVLWNGSTHRRYWRAPWSTSPIPYGLET
ncbi:unnamed protein product [Allacma fusca]|uniref:LolA-like domain-containing protein n=1 Tax=Allacma fusca TaxID=39272 RepID=A0A8J2JHB1_9HEXA|nr:unnamed protein product [Allacma fusca]